MTPGTAAAGEWSLVPLVDAALDVRVTGGQHPACPCNAINLSHQTIFIDRQVNERLIRKNSYGIFGLAQIIYFHA